MTVSFKWGQAPITLPDRRDFFIDKMAQYISDGDKGFLVKYRRALRGVNEENAKKIEEEFNSILKDVLEQSLVPLLKTEGEGWTRFTKTRKGKSSDDNQQNIDFIKDKKIKDILDADVVNRLRGSGITSYFKDGSLNLPDFNFFEVFRSVIDVDESVSLKEQELPRGKGRYNIKPTEGSEAHFSSDFPTKDEGKITNAKADFLNELLGTSPPFTPSSAEGKIEVEPIKYSFELSGKTLDNMNEKAKKSDNYLTPVELVGEEFKAKGKQIPQDTFSGLKILAAKDDLDNRTPKMQQEQVIIIDGTMYQYREKDTTGKKVFSVDFASQGNPFTFVKQHIPMFERILAPTLNDPATVKTVKLQGFIRTTRGKSKTFGQAATQSLKDKDSPSGQDKMFMFASKKHTETGEIISIEEWTELSEEEQTNYEHHEQELSQAEIIQISAKAYRSKQKDAEGEYSYMSEDDYNKLRSSIGSASNWFKEETALINELKTVREEIETAKEEEDTAKEEELKDRVEELEELIKRGNKIVNDNKALLNEYEPALTVLSGAEERSPKLTSVEEYGEDTYKTNEVNAGNIEDKFKNAYVDVDFIITTHGSFEMNPFAKTSANRPMSKRANKIKKHVRKLKREFGE